MDTVELVAERPVAGGRMLARADGRVVLVRGAIPGERVRARVERVHKNVVWADVIDVVEASADRRELGHPIACGGSLYAHIEYSRQCELKGQVVADALRRIGKIVWDRPVVVMPSREDAYRVRARLHVRNRRAGFLLEGTHHWCDASATRQLHPATIPAVNEVLDAIGPVAEQCAEAIVAENVTASQRVVHLEPRPGATIDLPPATDALLAKVEGITGITASSLDRMSAHGGTPTVTDTASELFGDDTPILSTTTWTRHAASFFQGNRYLIGSLIRRLLDLALGERVADLYAGVGLFAVALAARGQRVLAVEGDRVSSRDLQHNAAPWSGRLTAMVSSVERVVSRKLKTPIDVAIVDPPRSGMSTEALNGLLSWNVPRVVYVSCDPPTFARDLARMVGGGYRIQSINAFDLFPNTPHVETIAVTEKS